MLPAVLVPQEALFNILLILACVSMAGFSSNHWALTQRLSGVEAAGKWTGFENCIGNIAGIAANFVSGIIVHQTHSFFLAFAVTCGVVLTGAFGYWAIIGTPNPVVWRTLVTQEDPTAYTKP
jgi:MFS-type transporter involved in bile tolerance (Atg22 family)